MYNGRQVFLYKRAQIFAGDLYGAYGGRGLGAFTDIRSITMFADYRYCGSVLMWKCEIVEAISRIFPPARLTNKTVHEVSLHPPLPRRVCLPR